MSEKTGKTDATETPEGTPEVIEEDALLKSIQDIEAKASAEPEKTETPTPDPTVKTEGLEKSAGDAVAEGASDDLTKGLDVSPLLKEITDTLGAHIDTSLAALGKSITASAERGVALVKALGAVAEQVGRLETKVAEYGNQPTAGAGERAVQTPATEALAKTAGTGDEPAAASAANAQIPQAVLFSAAESLMKSAKAAGDTAAEDHWTHTAIKIDATGQLSEADFQPVVAEARKLMGTVPTA